MCFTPLLSVYVARPAPRAGLIPGSDRGVSLRFPRFLRDRSGEKAAEDATTVGEVAELYAAQARR
jgi:ATP-dependent DNA ligase